MEEILSEIQLPEHWTWSKINQLATLINGDRGKNYPSREDYVEKGIAFINAGNLVNGKILIEKMNCISEDKYNSLNNGKLAEQDIIYCLRGTLGKCAIFAGMKKGAIASSLVILRYIKEINHVYAYYFLISPFAKNLIKTFDNGTAQPNLSAKSLSNYPFPLPPLPEQRAIVSKIEQLFSDLDNGIANLRLAQEQLKVYRQAVLKKAFEGELTRKWRGQQTDLPDARGLLEQIHMEGEEAAKASGKKVKPVKPLTEDEIAELPGLPVGWRWVKLGELIKHIQAGKSIMCDERPPKPNEVGIVKVSSVSWGEFNPSESKTCFNNSSFNAHYIIHKGDFLISRANTIELVGACVIVKSNSENLMLSDKILRLDFTENHNKFYSLYYLRSFRGRKEIESLATGNQESMRNIGQDRIKEIVIPLCSLPEQYAIVQEIETRLSVCDKMGQDIDEALGKAEALRQSILKKAFEGKLLNERELAEVRMAEEWEPAEVLLERIKVKKEAKEKR